MVTMTPTQLGPDRARPSTPSHPAALSMPRSWRDGSGTSGLCGTTGLFVTATNACVKSSDSVGNRTQIDRPTRHLGTRST